MTLKQFFDDNTKGLNKYMTYADFNSFATKERLQFPAKVQEGLFLRFDPMNTK